MPLITLAGLGDTAATGAALHSLLTSYATTHYGNFVTQGGIVMMPWDNWSMVFGQATNLPAPQWDQYYPAGTNPPHERAQALDVQDFVASIAPAPPAPPPITVAPPTPVPVLAPPVATAGTQPQPPVTTDTGTLVPSPGCAFYQTFDPTTGTCGLNLTLVGGAAAVLLGLYFLKGKKRG